MPLSIIGLSTSLKLHTRPVRIPPTYSVDESYNHIGFFIIGESVTGFPSDFLWHRGVVFFGDPESQRATPISGFVTTDHMFLESVLHKWWRVLETSCVRKGQFWDARIYLDQPDEWRKVIVRVCDLILQTPSGNTGAAAPGR